MGRTLQHKQISNSQLVTAAMGVAGSTAAPIFQLSQPFPVGDTVYDHLSLRFYGALKTAIGGGNVIPDGMLQFLKAIYLSTPLHGYIYENWDGLLAADVLHIKNRARCSRWDPQSAAPGANANYEAYLRLPFKDAEGFAWNDLGLDLQRSGQPLLQINLGAYTDFVQGGNAADSVNTMNLETHAILDPGPVTDPDLPTEFMPYYSKLTFPVTATAAQQQIYLAFGDRIYKRIYVQQRDGSTFKRLPNTVVGASETDRLSLKVNSNIIFVDRLGWSALQRQNEFDYKLPVMPVGMAVLDFFRYILGGQDASSPRGGGAGAKLTDALSVISKSQGTIEIDVDVTAASGNPQLVIGYEAVKYIPLGARRGAAPAATSAKG